MNEGLPGGLSTPRRSRPRAEQLRVALLGAGALGGTIQEALAHDQIQGCRGVGVIRSETSPQVSRAILGDADVLVEAAGVPAARHWLPLAIEAGVDTVLCSCAVLVEPQFSEQLREATGTGRIVVPTGAIGAFDLLQAAVRACPDHDLIDVLLTTTKAAAAVGGSTSGLVFQGTARQAGAAFPRTANVAVALALATVGLDRVQVEVVADPAATRSRHHVRFRSPIGDYDLTVVNALAPGSGGRTSAVTAWSVVRTLEALAAHEAGPAILVRG